MTPDDTMVFAQIAVVTVSSVGAFVAISLGAHRFYLRSKRLSGLGAPDDGRMARLEQAVDSIAVEVERISEGQRFTTRLLNDRLVEQGSNQNAVANAPRPSA